MARPCKYATAKEAAQNNLYSKMAGQASGLPLDRFIHVATGKCALCGRLPQEMLIVDRKDDRHELAWHYVVTTKDGHQALCKMCRMLCSQFEISELISHCARIMARRMWQVHTKWTDAFLRGQD